VQVSDSSDGGDSSSCGSADSKNGVVYISLIDSLLLTNDKEHAPEKSHQLADGVIFTAK